MEHHITTENEMTNILDARTHITIHLINHGVKGGNPLPAADLYLDCRSIANPYHNKELSGMSGDDFKVQSWVVAHSKVSIDAFKGQILEAMTRLTDRRGEGKEYLKPFVICTMCAHGIHRSRAMKHILANWLEMGGWKVEVK